MPVRIAAVAAVLSLIFASTAVADATSPSTLSVDGSGSVMVTPDVASLTVSVARSATRSAVALSAANLRVRAIVAAIRAAGVPKAGIQTSSIDVSRGTIRVGPRKHQHRVRRYTATESLSITSTTSIVGHVIDSATHAGADSISGPDFSFSNPSAGAIAATNAALADARRRGNAAAASLGYRVTGVQSVDLNPQSSVVSPVSAGGAAPTPTSTTPTNIHPGAEEVDATVAIVYTIAPGGS